MRSVLKRLKSFWTERISGPKYTVQCTICFETKRGSPRKEVIRFLSAHAHMHGMNWKLKKTIVDLYHPLNKMIYHRMPFYVITKD